MLSVNVTGMKIHINYLRGIPAPALVSIDVSGACNLQCRMCSLADSNRRPGMMTIEMFDEINRQLDGIPVIELSSGCEPLLNPDLPAIIGSLRQRHTNAFLNLTTNATLLNDKIIDALIEHRINKLLISLDAAHKEIYEDIRRGARFDSVVSNIRNTCDRIRLNGKGRPEIEIIFTFMTINAGELEASVKLAAALGIPSFIVNGMVPFTMECDSLKMWGMNSEPPEALHVALDAARTARSSGIQLLFADFVARRVRRCLDANPVIGWDGDVFPCFMCSYDRTAYFDGRRIPMPRIVLGNLHRTSLLDIWQSPKATMFRTARAVGLLPKYCRFCAMQMGVLCPYRNIDLVVQE
jgi:MoaA/NifB/PqqE/SkfB family radical SAM enzyme